jgi:periplasmic protein TonB
MRRFAAISLGLHVALALVVGVLVWISRGPPARDAPDKDAAVELVIVEAQGTGPPTAPPEPAPESAASTQPELQAPDVPPPTQPADTADANEQMPPPPPAAPSPDPAQPSVPTPPVAAPPDQQAMRAPEINLPGNDAETNAVVIGNHVIPASIDAKSRNREPVYPPDAVRRAEQGAVILLIHVSPEGLASSVDVMESSGHASLDRAARDAVAAWHFLPAVKDGRPIPFDMPLRVTFQLE